MRPVAVWALSSTLRVGDDLKRVGRRVDWVLLFSVSVSVGVTALRRIDTVWDRENKVC